MANLRDGKVIPWIGYGTYLCSESEVLSCCSAALDNGYEHIDTAEGYGTEHAVGEVVKNHSKLPFITTKLWPLKSDSTPKSYDEVIESCELSLTKLGLSAVDLYLIHAPFGNSESRVEQWKAFVHLQAIGKCKSIGVSNYSIHHLEEIKQANLPLPVVNQLELHPLCQHRDIVDYCQQHSILPVAYSSLAPLSDWRPGQRSAKLFSPSTDYSEIFNKMSAKYNISSGQLLLKWGLQKGYPILPKSIHIDRIRANYSVKELADIDAADMEILDNMDENKPLAWPNGDPCLTP